MANPDKSSFKFMTPVDFVKNKKKALADTLEKQFFITYMQNAQDSASRSQGKTCEESDSSRDESKMFEH